MIFDENAPKSSQFQKPIFGDKTWLRKQDGSRTGLSYGLSAGLSWVSGLSPLGSKFGQQLDNMIQGGKQPGYLMDQDFYASNVRESEGKANAISTTVGGIADTVRSVASQVAGAMTGGSAAASSIVAPKASVVENMVPRTEIQATGSLSFNPMKPTEDPNTSFRSMLSRKRNMVMTPEQRRRNELESIKQTSLLPTQDNNFWGTETFSDSPMISPNSLKMFR